MKSTFIVQAGGVGSRMGSLTSIKPKALIPVDGKPLLFHLFDNNPNSKFIIITDYCSDVLIKYVNKYRKNVDVEFIASTEKSTSAGIKEAILNVNGSFFIIWSDLYVKSKIIEPSTDSIAIGITTEKFKFPCRWSVSNNKLQKIPADINGVCGLFYFKDKKYLQNIDEKKSLTNYLQNQNITTFSINDIEDVGDIERFYLFHKNNRFFNKLTFLDKVVIKESTIEEYNKLLKDEIEWYKYVKQLGFKKIPELLSENPFILEKLKGNNPFLNNPDFNFLNECILTLKEIHSLKKIKMDIEELKIVYFDKTFERINDVSDLIPFFENQYIKINKKNLLNPFHPLNIDKFKKEIELLYKSGDFTIIHGDCTFSNIINVDNKCYLIDPRGYFGKQKIFGDPRYDWAKLYYSFFGNYDNVNSKKYDIRVNKNDVNFFIEKNGWEKYENLFFNNIPYSKKEIYLMHTIIWFSLCGYVKEDYSSVLLSFYKGVELWNKYLKF